MATPKQERRKQLVVNKPLQGRLITNMALLPSIALAGIAVFTGFYVKGMMTEAIATDSELPNLMPLFYLVIIFELMAAVFLMVNSLKISHKVAGPAYRICKSLEQMRSGDISLTVKLRQGDHLGEIRDELNLLLDYLNENPPKGARTRAIAQAEAEAEAQTAAQEQGKDQEQGQAQGQTTGQPAATAETGDLLPIDNSEPAAKAAGDAQDGDSQASDAQAEASTSSSTEKPSS